jgi:hypothetical protein
MRDWCIPILLLAKRIRLPLLNPIVVAMVVFSLFLGRFCPFFYLEGSLLHTSDTLSPSLGFHI